MERKKLSSSAHHEVTLVETNGMKTVEKVAKDDEGRQRLEIQKISSSYFQSITPAELQIQFCSSNAHIDEHSSKLVYDYIEGKALSAVHEPVKHNALTDNEIQRLGELFHHLSTYSVSDLPDLLQTEADRYTKQVILERMQNHLASISSPLLNEKEKGEMYQVLKDAEFAWGLDIHDVTLWNMVRTPQNTLVILDTEYARWGMRWYDLGYFAIQTAVYGQNTEFARKVLLKWIHYLEEQGHQEIQKELLIPMFYRISVNLNECQKNDKQFTESLRIARQLLAFGVKGF